MLPTFVIGLREGVEASLIVGIVAAFIRQEGRRDALRWVWLGVAAALVICAAVGVGLQVLDAELPQREQEALETIVGLLAVCVVTGMIVWMRRHAHDMAGELRASAGAALAQGSVGALVGMAFFAVIREGMETAVFLLAAFQSATNPTTAGLGALLGVLVAVVIGIGIYRGGVRLNLGRFFRVTGFVLVLVAAGLVAGSLHTAHEAGWVNFGQDRAVDLSWLVVPGTWTASLLTGMLGLQPQPTVVEAAGYLVYAVPAAVYVLWPSRPRRARAARTARTAATATLLLALVLLLAACGQDEAPAGAKTVRIELTDAGCDPRSLKLDAGPTVFAISNAGTSKVSEFEVLDGDRVLGEKENLASGLSGEFTLNLEPGTYTISCPGGTSAATGTLEVGGTGVAGSDDPRLQAAMTSYAGYVETQAAEPNGANGLLDEVSASKITGEEDRYSHTDLSDFEANVSGSQTTFGLLAPALRTRDAQLADRIEQRFDAVQRELARLKQGGEHPSYDTVGTAEGRRLSQLVDAAAEPLSQVAGALRS